MRCLTFCPHAKSQNFFPKNLRLSASTWMNTVQLIVRGPVLYEYVNNRLREGVLFSNSLCLSPRPLNAWRIITPEVRGGADDSVLLKGGNRDSSLCISRSPGGVKENSTVNQECTCRIAATKLLQGDICRFTAKSSTCTTRYKWLAKKIAGTGQYTMLRDSSTYHVHTPAPELRAGPGFTVQERAKNRTVYKPTNPSLCLEFCSDLD